MFPRLGQTDLKNAVARTLVWLRLVYVSCKTNGRAPPSFTWLCVHITVTVQGRKQTRNILASSHSMEGRIYQWLFPSVWRGILKVVCFSHVCPLVFVKLGLKLWWKCHRGRYCLISRIYVKIVCRLPNISSSPSSRVKMIISRKLGIHTLALFGIGIGCPVGHVIVTWCHSHDHWWIRPYHFSLKSPGYSQFVQVARSKGGGNCACDHGKQGAEKQSKFQKRSIICHRGE